MNELKPEDVMEEAECCGYATGCTDCVLAKYDGRPCIVKKALALLREKDAEIERLKYNLSAVLEERADHTEAVAEAITEFAERFKNALNDVSRWQMHGVKGEYFIIGKPLIDQIAKEMKEDQNDD